MGSVVVCVAKILNILSQITEEEDVVLANFTGDFDLKHQHNSTHGNQSTYICSITSTDNQTSVQDELHVRSTTCLSTSS